MKKQIKYFERKFRTEKLIKSNAESFKVFRGELVSIGGKAAHIVLMTRDAIKRARGIVSVIFGAGDGALDSAVTVTVREYSHKGNAANRRTAQRSHDRTLLARHV